MPSRADDDTVTASAPLTGGLDETLTSVIIPARNEERFIRTCLESVLAQDESNLQVIVVDGDSDDATLEIVKEIAEADPRVELLHNPRRLIPISLNLAVDAARGAWLVRIDAHATVPSHYVRTAVAHLRTGRWGGVGGRKDGVGVTPAGRAVAAAMASPLGVGNSTYHIGTTAQTIEHIPFGAYPTALVRELGGWDEALAVHQDFEFDWRVRASGRQLLFDPTLVIHWHCRQSTADLFRQYRRYGRGKARVAFMHPASLRARHAAAPLLVAGLVVSSLLGLRSRRWLLAVGGPYAAVLALATAKTAPDVDDEAKPHLPFAFAAMHLGWGLGFWEGVATVLRERAAPR